MLGDGGNEVGGAEDFKVALDLGVHFGTVDDGAAGVSDTHLLCRERAPDDVLGEPLPVLSFIGRHSPAAVEIEAGVFPAAQHPGPLGRKKALFFGIGVGPA